jgi:diguanylate cyclase (GGDEF)-like protein
MVDHVLSSADARPPAAAAGELTALIEVPRTLLAAVIRKDPGALEELRDFVAQQPSPVAVSGFSASTAEAVRRFRGRRAVATHLIAANHQLVLAAADSAKRADTALEKLAELTRFSERDPLTGTPNRALMLDRIERSIGLARRQQTRAAILFADLDGFKQINDTLGHAIGDEALRVASRRFESVVRDSDTVSRHGGDEFLVVLGALGLAMDAGAIAGKLLIALAQPAAVGNHLLHLSASIGIAIYPDDAKDIGTLISGADEAMFSAKRHGPGNYEFWKTPSSSC